MECKYINARNAELDLGIKEENIQKKKKIFGLTMYLKNKPSEN